MQEFIDQKKITPYRLAKLSGVSQPQISRLLTGENSDPRQSTLQKLAAGLGVSVSELIGDNAQAQ